MGLELTLPQTIACGNERWLGKEDAFGIGFRSLTEAIDTTSAAICAGSRRPGGRGGPPHFESRASSWAIFSQAHSMSKFGGPSFSNRQI